MYEHLYVDLHVLYLFKVDVNSVIPCDFSDILLSYQSSPLCIRAHTLSHLPHQITRTLLFPLHCSASTVPQQWSLYVFLVWGVISEYLFTPENLEFRDSDERELVTLVFLSLGYFT